MAIVRHIQRNVARRIAIAELADIARLSVYALVRAFRRDHAITPYELILAIKIRRARRMLRAGTSIADTAFLVGFADQSHFTRHFKRLTGQTPHRFLTASTPVRVMAPGATLDRVAARVSWGA